MEKESNRTIGLASAVLIMIGFIVGGAIFLLMPTLSGITGPSLWITYLIAALPSIFGGLYVIQLVGVIPCTASHFIGITQWVSPTWGAAFSFSTVIAMVAGACFVSFGAAQYLSVVIPNLPAIPVTIALIVLFVLINCLGIQMAAAVQGILTVILIVIMLAYSFGGLETIKAENFQPFYTNGTTGFLIGIAICSFAWSGITAIAEIAGDIKNPKRNIPLAILLTILSIGILYVFFAYVFVGNYSTAEIAKEGDTAVLAAAKNFLPDYMLTFTYMAALVAMFTTLNGFMLVATREIIAMSDKRILPAGFGKLAGKRQTPINGLILFGMLAIIASMFAGSLRQYSTLLVFVICELMILGALATIRMAKKSPEYYRQSNIKFSPFWRWFVFIGCVLLNLCIFVFAFMSEPVTGCIFIGLLALSFVYYYIRRAVLKGKGEDLTSELKELTFQELKNYIDISKMSI